MANESATPQRRCIASGRVMDKQAMVRFVAGPENRIVADVEKSYDKAAEFTQKYIDESEPRA